jgi:hypothetical protein
MRTLLLLLLLGLATPAHAQPAAEQESSEGPICADRGGLASSTCIVEPGSVQVELAIDWSFQEDGDARTDTLLPATRWCGSGSTSAPRSSSAGPPTAASATGSGREVTSDDSVGDAFVGSRRSLYDQDGVAVALQGRFSLPIGGSAIGAGSGAPNCLLRSPSRRAGSTWR